MEGVSVPVRYVKHPAVWKMPTRLTAGPFISLNEETYLTAMTSTRRMSGSRASKSGPTWARARGISPFRWACRASSVSKVSKIP